jgi:hypothetical protein
MNIEDVLRRLVGTKDSFESALSQIAGIDGGELLIRLIARLEDAPEMENAERERRLMSTFGKVYFHAGQLASIAEAGSKLTNPVLRNALTRLLPPEQRALIFRIGSPVPPESAQTKITSPFLLSV